VAIYNLVKGFPRNEEIGLTSQLKRTAVSIPGNIAEGAARNSKREFVQFLYIARGSISEVDTHLEIALRLRFITQEMAASIETRMMRIDKMLAGLIQFLKKRV
jgi:four helix bundle protein